MRFCGVGRKACSSWCASATRAPRVRVVVYLHCMSTCNGCAGAAVAPAAGASAQHPAAAPPLGRPAARTRKPRPPPAAGASLTPQIPPPPKWKKRQSSRSSAAGKPESKTGVLICCFTLDVQCAGCRCCGSGRTAAGPASCAAGPRPLSAHARADGRLSSGSVDALAA